MLKSMILVLYSVINSLKITNELLKINTKYIQSTSDFLEVEQIIQLLVVLSGPSMNTYYNYNNGSNQD